ncbi:MAG: hypothetical protein ACXWV2_12550 [Chitinophagaceae bacterium]
MPGTANEAGRLIKTALLQLYKVAVGKAVFRKNECFSGLGLSIAINHESVKQPALISTVPVAKLSLSFLQDIKVKSKTKMKRVAFCMAFFSLTTTG